MKKYRKLLISRGILGMLLGLAIGYTVVMMMTLVNESYTFTGSSLLLNYTAGALIGFYMGAVSVVFHIEEWSLLKQTVIHFISNLPYLFIAFLIGWAPEQSLQKIFFVLFYIAVYVLIWLKGKSYWTKKSIELNKELQNLKV